MTTQMNIQGDSGYILVSSGEANSVEARTREMSSKEANSREMERLSKQHDVIKNAMGGLLLVPAGLSTGNLRILDSGTADGQFLSTTTEFSTMLFKLEHIPLLQKPTKYILGTWIRDLQIKLAEVHTLLLAPSWSKLVQVGADHQWA